MTGASTTSRVAIALKFRACSCEKFDDCASSPVLAPPVTVTNTSALAVYSRGVETTSIQPASTPSRMHETTTAQ